MKIIQLVISFLFIVYTKEEVTNLSQVEFFHKSQALCMRENNVDLEETQKIWTDPSYAADKVDLKCYYNCMNTKMGITDGDGNIKNISLIENFAHYDDFIEINAVEGNCQNVTAVDGDLCEYGYALIKCVLQI